MKTIVALLSVLAFAACLGACGPDEADDFDTGCGCLSGPPGNYVACKKESENVCICEQTNGDKITEGICR